MAMRAGEGAVRRMLGVVSVVACTAGGIGGARVASAQAAPPAAAATVAVTGTVYDSVARAPLAGALVQLVDAANQARVVNATTDSSGTFHVAMAPGRYIGGFFHPAVDVLGIEPPLIPITIPAAATATIALAIPGPTAIMTALCGPRAPGDSSGTLVGRVRDADTGTPVDGARVVVSWPEITIDAGGLRQVQRRVPAQTRADGGYAICGLPNDRLIVSADSGMSKTGLIEVDIPTSGLVRRDLSVAGPAAAVATPADSTRGAPRTTVLRGTARLTGTVRRPDGHPMSGARVTVWGTGLSTTTGADGRFTLSGLPAGTFSAQARAIGFSPATTSVDLASDRTASASITLAEPATTLAPVTVYGKPNAALREFDQFMQRKRQGFGHFLTPADLQNRFAVTDALKMVPGLQVLPTGMGNAVYGRGACIPTIYIDDMKLPPEVTLSATTPPDIDAYVQPDQIMGIEVYAGLGGIPPQYESNSCGVILIWTRR